MLSLCGPKLQSLWRLQNFFWDYHSVMAQKGFIILVPERIPHSLLHLGPLTTFWSVKRFRGRWIFRVASALPVWRNRRYGSARFRWRIERPVKIRRALLLLLDVSHSRGSSWWLHHLADDQIVAGVVTPVPKVHIFVHWVVVIVVVVVVHVLVVVLVPLQSLFGPSSAVEMMQRLGGRQPLLLPGLCGPLPRSQVGQRLQDGRRVVWREVQPVWPVFWRHDLLHAVYRLRPCGLSSASKFQQNAMTSGRCVMMCRRLFNFVRRLWRRWHHRWR